MLFGKALLGLFVVTGCAAASPIPQSTARIGRRAPQAREVPARLGPPTEQGINLRRVDVVRVPLALVISSDHSVMR